MTIGIDASRANKPYKTGIEWYSYYLIQELKKITDPSDRFILYSREALGDGLEVLPANWKSKVLGWPPGRLWTQVRLSWEMLRRPPELLFVPAHVIPLIHPKKVITTCHDIGFERLPEFYSSAERKYQRFAVHLAIKHVLKIITPSHFTKKELIGVFNVSPEQVTPIHNGYNSRRYKLVEDKNKIEEVLQKYNFKKPYILHISRLGLKKNTPGLVKAFGILKKNLSPDSDLKLALIGRPAYGFNKVTEAIIENNLHDEVIIPGWVDEEDLPYLLAGAELFVFPSFYEGFGIPVLEAMACGTPTVAADIEPLREIAGGAAYFIDPARPEEIASGISRLLTDDTLKDELKLRGLAQAQKFSWEKCARETLSVIYQLK